MATIDAAAPARAGDRTRLRALLALGDTVSFLAFAAIGRSSHNEAALSALGAVAGTAAPFLLGWFAVAIPAGAFREPEGGVRRLVPRTALAWLGAWPVGLLVRAIVLQRGIPLSFAIVVLLTNTVLLCGWRAAFAWWAARRSQ